MDPNDILARASELHVERGLTKKINGDTFLVAKGRSHSLLIKLGENVGAHNGTIILDFHKTTNLTIGSLYSKIELIVDNNFINSEIYVTRNRLHPYRSLIRESGLSLQAIAVKEVGIYAKTLRVT